MSLSKLKNRRKAKGLKEVQAKMKVARLSSAEKEAAKEARLKTEKVICKLHFEQKLSSQVIALNNYSNIGFFISKVMQFWWKLNKTVSLKQATSRKETT